MDWGLLDHSERRVFKIPVGNLSPEDAHDLLKKLMKEYNTEIDMSVIVRMERRLKLDKIIGKINEE